MHDETDDGGLDPTDSDLGGDGALDGAGDGDGDGDVDGDADGDADGDGDADADGDREAFDVGWTRTFGGPDQVWPSAVLVAPDDSVIVTGTFRGAVDFDPGPGEAVHETGEQREMYVLKLSPRGYFRWVRVFGVGSARDSGVAMTVTPDGSLILTGRFSDVVDFDPDPEGTEELSSSGDQDLFVVCLDRAGEFRWAQTFGGVGSDWGTGLAVDPDGAVLVAGRFWGVLDFDHDPERVDERGLPGLWSMFVVSLEPETGDFQWVSTFEGSGDVWGTGLAVDEEGLIVSGRFEGEIDFDPRRLSSSQRESNGERDIFVAALGAEGELRWVRTYGQEGEDWATSVAVTAGGDQVLLTGYFEESIGFDGGLAVHHESEGYWDAFVLGLDLEGDRRWSTSFGGEGWDWGAGVAAMEDGVLVAGTFEERVVFDALEDERASAGGWDAFLVKLSPAGSLQWVRTWGALGWDYADDVAVAPDGSIVVVGSFERTLDFDPCEGSDLQASLGESDTFVTRLRSNGCYL